MRTAILLRAVNLGSHNKLAMPQVKRLLERHGHREVATYLQTGNVVVAGEVKADEVAALLGVEVVTRSHAELAELVSGNPFEQHLGEPAKLGVAFCDREPTGSPDPGAYAPDEFIIKGKDIYLWYPNGMGRSKLNASFGKKLGVTATVRNWNTVRKLLEMTGPEQ